MDKFRAQGLLWSKNNASEKNVCAFCAFVRVNICMKNLDYLPDRATQAAQNAQQITDLTWTNK
jgi:hypothetical protein